MFNNDEITTAILFSINETKEFIAGRNYALVASKLAIHLNYYYKRSGKDKPDHQKARKLIKILEERKLVKSIGLVSMDSNDYKTKKTETWVTYDYD